MDPSLVASLRSHNPSNAPPQSNASGLIPPTVPVNGGQQPQGDPLSARKSHIPRSPNKGNASPYPITLPPPPYGVPIGGPAAMIIDPYGNRPRRQSRAISSSALRTRHIGSNVGDIGSNINNHNGTIVINGRDWSRVPLSQWPPQVMQQYRQGMAAGAHAVEQVEQMMQNMGRGMGTETWGMQIGGWMAAAWQGKWRQAEGLDAEDVRFRRT